LLRVLEQADQTVSFAVHVKLSIVSCRTKCDWLRK